LEKEITVVPDQDKAGVKLVDRAMELGWAVSMPEWGIDIKDVNDAVKKYGKVATLLSIFEARNISRIKIEMTKKNLLRKLNSND
jgi:DNA primase